MSSINPAYISALESRDIKGYPNEISKIPNRGSVAAPDAERCLAFSEVVAGVTSESPNLLAEAILPQAKSDKPFRLWEKEQFGFGDFVDIINPLQHIPIVATIYRHMTGDKIGFAPRVIGGAVWGRIGGFVSGAVNGIVDWFTGKDIGDYIYGALFGTPDESSNNVRFAQSKSSFERSGIQTAIPATTQPMPEQVKSSFGPFNDDGGFALGAGALKEVAVAQQEPFVDPVIIAALNSYAQNVDLDESKQPFRFRFPA